MKKLKNAIEQVIEIANSTPRPSAGEQARIVVVAAHVRSTLGWPGWQWQPIAWVEVLPEWERFGWPDMLCGMNDGNLGDGRRLEMKECFVAGGEDFWQSMFDNVDIRAVGDRADALTGHAAHLIREADQRAWRNEILRHLPHSRVSELSTERLSQWELWIAHQPSVELTARVDALLGRRWQECELAAVEDALLSLAPKTNSDDEDEDDAP